MWFLTLLLESEQPAAPPPPIDLSNLTGSARCAEGAPDEIVVCAKKIDPETFRIRPLVPPEVGPPRAEMRLFGPVRGSLTVQEHSAGNASAPAAMVHIKVPF